MKGDPDLDCSHETPFREVARTLRTDRRPSGNWPTAGKQARAGAEDGVLAVSSPRARHAGTYRATSGVGEAHHGECGAVRPRPSCARMHKAKPYATLILRGVQAAGAG